ncbi:hypothetical protein TMatcc_006355 [Talaromyces marneffei ATCC 18224]
MVSPPDYSDAFNPVDKDTKTLEKCIAARIEGYSDLYDDELWLTVPCKTSKHGLKQHLRHRTFKAVPLHAT